MFDRDRLITALIKHLFWGRHKGKWNSDNYATDENIEIINRAINIAQCQLPRHLVNNDRAIYQRCVELFGMGGYYWYGVWC